MYKEDVVIYSGILLNHKKEWYIGIFSNMDELRDYYTKWNICQKHIRCHSYVESKKKDTNELIYKTEINSDTENKLMITKGENGEGGIN